MLKSCLKIATVLMLLAGTSACDQKTEQVNVLRIGILPDQAPEELRRRYKPLFEHISAAVGLPYKLVMPSDYGDMLSRFKAGQIELAYFGGLTYLLAAKTAKAQPLVMREADSRFVSHFVVRADAPQTRLEDFRGKKLVFGSKLSTSGHLMPRFHLQRINIKADEFFSSVIYSGAHDKTVSMVVEGKADIGAANGLIVEEMMADRRLGADQLRILWTTPHYPDYVWAIQNSIPEKVRDKLQDAFLQLSIFDKKQAEILSRIGAKTFIPARPADFRELTRQATLLGLMND